VVLFQKNFSLKLFQVISAALGKRCSSTQILFLYNIILLGFLTCLKSYLSCKGPAVCCWMNSGGKTADFDLVTRSPKALPALPGRAWAPGGGSWPKWTPGCVNSGADFARPPRCPGRPLRADSGLGEQVKPAAARSRPRAGGSVRGRTGAGRHAG